MRHRHVNNLEAKRNRLAANSEIIHQMNRAIKRLTYAVEGYEESGLPDTLVEFNINQVIHTLKNVKKGLHLN